MFLLNNSTTHRIPFRRSNIDIFEIDTFDLGVINAIKVGHSERDIGELFENIILV